MLKNLKEPQGASRSLKEPQGASQSLKEPQGASRSLKKPQEASRSLKEPQGASRTVNLKSLPVLIFGNSGGLSIGFLKGIKFAKSMCLHD